MLALNLVSSSNIYSIGLNNGNRLLSDTPDSPVNDRFKQTAKSFLCGWGIFTPIDVLTVLQANKQTSILRGSLSVKSSCLMSVYRHSAAPGTAMKYAFTRFLSDELDNRGVDDVSKGVMVGGLNHLISMKTDILVNDASKLVFHQFSNTSVVDQVEKKATPYSARAAFFLRDLGLYVYILNKSNIGLFCMTGYTKDCSKAFDFGFNVAGGLLTSIPHISGYLFLSNKTIAESLLLVRNPSFLFPILLIRTCRVGLVDFVLKA